MQTEREACFIILDFEIENITTRMRLFSFPSYSNVLGLEANRYLPPVNLISWTFGRCIQESMQDERVGSAARNNTASKIIITLQWSLAKHISTERT